MPFVTPNWVYVGMPKTGSHFMHTALKDIFGEEGFTADFETYESIPEVYKKRPVICSIRNPWAWYVSYWTWYSAEHRRGDRRGIAGGKVFEDWLQENPNLMEQEIKLTYPDDAHLVRIEFVVEDLIKVLNTLEPEPLNVRERLKLRKMEPLNQNPDVQTTYASYYTTSESQGVVLHAAARIFVEYYPAMRAIEWPGRPAELPKKDEKGK